PLAAPREWHFADPEDLHRLASPARQYGLLQSTGTQKILFGRPRVVEGHTSIAIPDPPHLADAASLLNATGAFPGLADALPFPAGAHSLEVKPQGLGIQKQDFSLNSMGIKTLVSIPPIELKIDYTNARSIVEIDPAAGTRWSVRI